MTEDNQFFTFMNLFLFVKYKAAHSFLYIIQFAVLLDVGLRPEAEALHKMYKYMRKNPKVGGVCGYMSLKI